MKKTFSLYWLFIPLIFLLIILFFYPTEEGMKTQTQIRRRRRPIIIKEKNQTYMPPPELITWKPYVLDIYNQPAYHAYFYDNHYMYPLF
jgi:hypothetical protein